MRNSLNKIFRVSVFFIGIISGMLLVPEEASCVDEVNLIGLTIAYMKSADISNKTSYDALDINFGLAYINGGFTTRESNKKIRFKSGDGLSDKEAITYLGIGYANLLQLQLGLGNSVVPGFRVRSELVFHGGEAAPFYYRGRTGRSYEVGGDAILPAIALIPVIEFAQHGRIILGLGVGGSW